MNAQKKREVSPSFRLQPKSKFKFATAFFLQIKEICWCSHFFYYYRFPVLKRKRSFLLLHRYQFCLSELIHDPWISVAAYATSLNATEWNVWQIVNSLVIDVGHTSFLNQEECAYAIAIAASMSSGLRRNFGTMTKSYHVGMGASQGIHAATLAKNGFTGSKEIFCGEGFLYAFTGGENVEQINFLIEKMAFGKPYDLLDTGLAVKKFPCCYATHRLIRGVLTFKEENNLAYDQVEEMTIVVPPGQLMPLVHSRPVTGLQGKFSAEYTALTALKDGYIKLSCFEDDQVMRPEIQRMFPSVKFSEMEGTTKTSQEIEEIAFQITIKLTDGKTLAMEVQHAPGSKSSPLSEAEHRGKWVDCIAQYAKVLEITDDQIQEKANRQYDNGLKLDAFNNFSDWIAQIHQ